MGLVMMSFGGAMAHRWTGCPWILVGLPRWPKGHTLMGWWGIAKRNEHNHSGSSAPPAPLRQTAVRDFRTAMDVGWQSECKPQTRPSIGRIRITKGRALNLCIDLCGLTRRSWYKHPGQGTTNKNAADKNATLETFITRRGYIRFR